MTYTYYRYETGTWYLTNRFNHLARPNQNVRQINLNMQEQIFKMGRERGWNSIPQYNVIQYFHPVTVHSVFSTFCRGTTNVITRLVFRAEWGTEFDAWRRYNNLRQGDYFTRITITTDKPLPLAEDYISEYEWTNERGIDVKGCPEHAMQLQGVTCREYVVQPDDIISIQIQHYQI